MAKKKDEPKIVVEKIVTPVNRSMIDKMFDKTVEEVAKDQETKINPKRLERLKAFGAKVNSHAEGVLQISKAHSKALRLSSGILELDLALGGGWVCNGKMVLIWGKQSQGKSEICYRSIAEAQQHCTYCIETLDECVCGEKEPILCNMIDIENSWDDDWAKSKGVDPDLVSFAQPDKLEDTVDYITESINQKLYGLHILDSIAMSTPEQELADGQSKWQQGLSARIQNKGWRAWTNALNRSAREGFPQLLIVINQEREKIGVMFGDPTTKPGGKSQEFMPSIIVKTQSPEYKKFNNPISGAEETYMVELAGVIEKNKTAPAKSKYTFSMYTRDYDGFAKGFIDEKSFLLGCIEKCGWLIKHSPTKWALHPDLTVNLGIAEEVVDKETGETFGDTGCKLDAELGLIFKTKGSMMDAVVSGKRYSKMRRLIVKAVVTNKIDVQLDKCDKTEEQIEFEHNNAGL